MPKRKSEPTELDRKIYAYYERRKALSKRKQLKFADWEEDRAFLGVMLALYPADCELACFSGNAHGSKPSKARHDLKMRYEGHNGIADARALIESLADAAQQALVDLAEAVPDASASSDRKK